MVSDKISIKEIARIVGVSTTTVSIVINGKGPQRKINSALVTRIFDVIANLNYQPNSFARSLRSGRSGNVGFLVDDVTQLFFPIWQAFWKIN